MIRNMVFDMGQVLTNYEADRVCRHFMQDPAQIKAIGTAVFLSQEWVLLDMGLISEEEGLRRMQSRLETDQDREMAALCFDHWHEYNLMPRQDMGELVRELHAEGYGIYLCSNASVRMLTCWQRAIPGAEYFDGMLFSAQVKCMKPQKEMYQHLFERFSLKPEECFFIDDQELNIQGAQAVGMDGYCFQDGDIEKLKERLGRLKEGIQG